MIFCNQLARLFLGLFDGPICFISVLFDLLGWGIIYNFHELSVISTKALNCGIIKSVSDIRNG